MCKLPSVKDVFICSGHSCWGILCGPYAGLIMSELIVDGHCQRIPLYMFQVPSS